MTDCVLRACSWYEDLSMGRGSRRPQLQPVHLRRKWRCVPPGDGRALRSVQQRVGTGHAHVHQPQRRWRDVRERQDLRHRWVAAERRFSTVRSTSILSQRLLHKMTNARGSFHSSCSRLLNVQTYSSLETQYSELETYWWVGSMHLSQHDLCTRKTELVMKLSRLSPSLHGHGDGRWPTEWPQIRI